MNQIITSAFLKLNLRDLVHGLYIAIIGSISDFVYQWLSVLQSTGHFVAPDWKQILNTAGIATIAFLTHRWITPAQIITPVSPSTTDVTK